MYNFTIDKSQETSLQTISQNVWKYTQKFVTSYRL